METRTMKVKLLRLKVADKWINSIKALRLVTNLGLKEAKDMVEDMRNGATPEINVDITDKRARFQFDSYFAYGNAIELKLFMVTTVNGRHVLILSEYKSMAENLVVAHTTYAVKRTNEITGPFKDGTILADFED